jgi:endo-1,4-beta-xylanase
LLHRFAVYGGVTLSLGLLLASCGAPPQGQATNSEAISAPDAEGIEAQAAAPALPAGGADVLGADTFSAFDGGTNPSLKIETLSVSGKPFTQARRISGVGPFENPTSAQLVAKTRLGVTKGDTLLVQFWARSVGGPAQTEFVFESDDDYVQSVFMPFNMLPKWTLYSVPILAAKSSGPNEAAARFRMGYQGQSFELGGVVLKNYGPGVPLSSLPFAGFSYVGREKTAAWRSAAAQRIEQLRKGNVSVKVVNAAGLPVSGAAIKLNMTRHAFAFGSAVNADLIADTGPESAKYRQTVRELFNRVVFENDLKWPSWESEFQATTRKALDVLRSQDIAVRGHNLLWGCSEDECYPQDVPGLLSNPAALRTRIDQHFTDILGATRGKIVEWDVINEPSAGKRLNDVLGEDEMAAQLRRAKQLDPGARMIINDNSTLGEGNSTAEFMRLLKRVQALGGPLEGIGHQGHFQYKLTPPEDLNARLNDFGALGVPLSITEFDVNLPDEKLQADYLRDFLTVIFANKHVDSFTMWGFWENRHWLPQAALYRSDWSIKPNGQAFKDLLFRQWWTNASGSSDAAGRYQARGFYGDYRLSVTAGGKTETRNIRLEKNMGEVVVRLP